MIRSLLNSWLDLLGITDRRWRNRPPGLYCFNFHRVGNDAGDSFHPNLYSCTGSRFEELVTFLRSEFVMIGLDRLLELVETREVPSDRYGMITFDDGYVDNFDVAFPILQRANCPALFFLPTNFIGGREIPWWDQIAWCVYNGGSRRVVVPGIADPIQISAVDLRASIRSVLRAVKRSAETPIADKVDAIREQIPCPDLQEAGLRLFMSWNDAREMRRSGMWFGSHCASHRILSHLNEDEQRAELLGSRREIEAELGEPIVALSYPVGGLDSYTDVTRRMAAACGYKVAFNFVAGGGINQDPAANRFDLMRISIDEDMSVRAIKRMVGAI